jgi:hypothetical protein
MRGSEFTPVVCRSLKGNQSQYRRSDREEMEHNDHFVRESSMQHNYVDLGNKEGDFPVRAKLAAESLARPIQTELAVGDIDYICDSA